MSDCLFCKIISGKIPAKKVYEDEHTFAFEDIDPKAPTHILVVPKKHIVGLKEASSEDAETVGRCHLAAANIAKSRGIEDGYRTVLNVGPGAGQSVFHLHVHLLGGRKLSLASARRLLRRPTLIGSLFFGSAVTAQQLRQILREAQSAGNAISQPTSPTFCFQVSLHMR